MKYNLHTENIELTDLDHQFLQEKLGRLKKHLHPPYILDVTLTRDGHHRQGNVVNCRLNLEMGGAKRTFYADRSDNSVQTCLDQAIAALEHELQKWHDKNKP